MRPPEKAAQRLRHELKVSETLQRAWNALSAVERISVAKISPDLSLFFRRGLANADCGPGLTGKVIDLEKKVQRVTYRRLAREHECASGSLELEVARKIRRWAKSGH
jgi:hypothetical protein